MTKSTSRKKISQGAFDKAVSRYLDNTNKTKKIIGDSETRIQNEMAKRNEKLGNMPKELEEDEATIIQYCEDNREQLFADSKTYDTGVGVTISYRTGQPKLEYGDGVKAEDLIAAFKKKDMLNYIKTKDSLDARAVINDAEQKDVAKVLKTVGASVEQNETISVSIKKV